MARKTPEEIQAEVEEVKEQIRRLVKGSHGWDIGTAHINAYMRQLRPHLVKGRTKVALDQMVETGELFRVKERGAFSYWFQDEWDDPKNEQAERAKKRIIEYAGQTFVRDSLRQVFARYGLNDAYIMNDGIEMLTIRINLKDAKALDSIMRRKPR